LDHHDGGAGLMLKLTTTIVGTDLRPRIAKKALRDAQDRGLNFHRRKFMPLHFETFSRARYGKEYSKKPGEYSRKSNSSRKRGTVRRDVERERRMERSKQGSNDSASTAQKKRPLFDTGLTRAKILRGGVKITGRYDKRGMAFNVPFYIKINPPGQLDKVRALNAIHPSEERKDGIIVEKLFFQNLEKNQTTKKG